MDVIQPARAALPTQASPSSTWSASKEVVEGGKSHLGNEPEAVPGHELLVSFRKPLGKLSVI